MCFPLRLHQAFRVPPLKQGGLAPVANPPDMCAEIGWHAAARRGRRGLRAPSLLLVACGGLFLTGAMGFAADRLGALEKAPEWQQLAALWQAMLDHSSNVIYSPERFQELAKDMDAVETQAAALVKRGLLPAGAAPDLTRLFHDRYEYLRTRHYTTDSHVGLTAGEAAAVTSQWIIELQLAGARQVNPDPREDRAALSRAEASIVYELGFLTAYQKLESEAQTRRKELLDEQAAGKEVDLKALDNDCERRRNLLLEAYRGRSLRAPRSVRSLMPYLTSLTRLRPPSPPAVSPPTVPGL